MHPLKSHVGRRFVFQHRTVEITDLRCLGRKQYLVGKDEDGVEMLIPPRVMLRSTKDVKKPQ
jgi:hypothetical protein